MAGPLGPTATTGAVSSPHPSRVGSSSLARSPASSTQAFWSSAEAAAACRYSRTSRESGARITLTDNADDALRGVDFVHTDVWVSMGEPKEVWDERVELLGPYQVNAAAIEKTGNPRAKFMHCLPAYHDKRTVVGREIMEHTGLENGLEVTEEVFESARSIVFDQAENRLHTIKAVLVATIGTG